jgi:UDP-N-acetylmuramate dehydrogenase
MLLQIREQDLTDFNTLGLRSRARALVRYQSMTQLVELSEVVSHYGRALVLGGGSNVVLPHDLDHLVIKVESRGVRKRAETSSELLVEAHAGESWHDFVAHCVSNGWNGLENLALIPGTVGAAPVQNIGAYGVELDQRFHSLVAWDLRARRMVEMGANECGFSYRDSIFKQAEPGRWLILKVRFRLPKPWRPVLDYPDLAAHPIVAREGANISAAGVFQAVCRIRQQKLPDPTVLSNAGSFFKNPIVTQERYDAIKSSFPGVAAYSQPNGSYKLAAGWLIDQAGWKGRRMGDVGVHDRQALVLVNYGGAQAEDIDLLADNIRNDVAARFGVELEQEPVAVM